MNNSLFRPAVIRLAFLAWLLATSLHSYAQYTNGIYAEFNTSKGSYTCALYYASAPKAVANFIGLASGQRSWLDLPSGLVKTNPFYNGLIFHRDITNFVIQAGSPNGLGTDGPGYAFVDEITNVLQFDSYGVLAMANSGPDSNGSQFFVTATNSLPNLNNRYTVFGRLFGGSNVVYAINHVATDANNKPLTNVVLNTLTIRRVGTAATAFDINTNGLPLVTNLNLRIARSGSNVSLTFSNRLYADTRFYKSSDLANWASGRLGIDLTGTPTNSMSTPINTNRQFFRGAQILYPSSTFAPKTITNRTLTMIFTNGFSGTTVINLNAGGGGTYAYNGTNGPVLYAPYTQLPFNGQLWPIGFDGVLNFDLTANINFDTATAGGFSGTIYPPPDYYPYAYPTYPVTGSFTISP